MSLAYYYSLLSEKQTQLQRLKTCTVQLQGKQEEFTAHRRNVTEPELSSDTWQGTLAMSFDDNRTGGMLQAYTKI
ncbi:hypothetical protein [Peribacillus simplex]|uniref:hypothetical protein n=1 Tax=Peribacillus simplex TaxID=1478 RepID=UPI003D2911B7